MRLLRSQVQHFTVTSGINNGTSGPDFFTLSENVGTLEIHSGSGYDTFRAPINLLSNWTSTGLDHFSFYGSSNIITSFIVTADDVVVNLRDTESTVVVDLQGTEINSTGGRHTVLNAYLHEITEFDMQTGLYEGTFSGAALQNRLTGFDGVIAGGGNDRVFGSWGDETVILGAGTNTFDGRSGFNTYGVVGDRSEFSISNSDGVFTITKIANPAGHNAVASNIERIGFYDTSYNKTGELAFDLDGNAGQTYRLYKAAFDRTPDDAGLSHNVALMDDGMSIYGMADAFIRSAEFIGTYGHAIDDTAFITLLYNNVLNRNPDTAGLAGWADRLASGTWDRNAVLFGFSESAENKANVAAEINDGIWLI